ncbi:MAG: RagB/SusD family nutrient uptake outer membrane protein [Saonia sp.]
MKKTNYLLYIAVIVLLFSCSEDFLEFTPPNDIATTNFWATQNDAEAGVVGCYDALQPDSYYGFDYFVLGDVRSDNSFAGGDNSNNFAIDNFNLRPTNEITTRFWRQLYTAIGRTNIAIDRITPMDNGLFEDGRKDALLGEVHFLRGLHYFNLVRLFGGVPLVVNETLSLDPDEIQVPRSSENQIYQQVIADLQNAITLLGGKDQEAGRATVGAAEGLLAKVQLTLGNNQAVLSLTSSVMQRGFSLLPSFESLFDQQNKTNNEVLFAVQYNGGQEGNVFPELILPVPEASFEFIKFNTPTPNSEQLFEDDDLRKASSLVNRNDILYVFKWREGAAFNSSDYSIVLRYADVLLMRAEALNLSGNTGEAIVLLNQIRNRAGLPDYAGPTSQAAIDTAILQERRLELMFEGQRWFDLKRKGLATAQQAIQTAKGISIQSFQLLFPVPQGEIDRNERLEQNTGY